MRSFLAKLQVLPLLAVVRVPSAENATAQPGGGKVLLHPDPPENHPNDEEEVFHMQKIRAVRPRHSRSRPRPLRFQSADGTWADGADSQPPAR